MKNIEMEGMLAALEKHLARTDLIGYAAARNTRVLRDELLEYRQKRDELVCKHGEPQVDEKGRPTGVFAVDPESDGFGAFVDELNVIAGVEHEPRLFTIPFEEAIGRLSGSELLEIEWMFEE
jgi:hypothetical protein